MPNQKHSLFMYSFHFYSNLLLHRTPKKKNGMANKDQQRQTTQSTVCCNHFSHTSDCGAPLCHCVISPNNQPTNHPPTNHPPTPRTPSRDYLLARHFTCLLIFVHTYTHNEHGFSAAVTHHHTEYMRHERQVFLQCS